MRRLWGALRMVASGRSTSPRKSASSTSPAPPGPSTSYLKNSSPESSRPQCQGRPGQLDADPLALLEAEGEPDAGGELGRQRVRHHLRASCPTITTRSHCPICLASRPFTFLYPDPVQLLAEDGDGIRSGAHISVCEVSGIDNPNIPHPTEPH